MICLFNNKPHFSKGAHVVQSNVAQTCHVHYYWASSSGIQWWVCTFHNYQNCKVLGEFMLWCTKTNYHNLTISSIYSSLMHHGDYLENILWWKFVMDDGICSTLWLC
jgi:hypothetical protein